MRLGLDASKGAEALAEGLLSLRRAVERETLA